MKFGRNRKVSKILTYYSNNFQYRKPYQILVDATFCQAALQHKISIEEQLNKYLQCSLRYFTTQCIIIEAEFFGSLVGATNIVKKFNVHKCGHEGRHVTAASCLKSMVKRSMYIVATQDRSLQHFLRKIPGQALLYLHRSTPVMDPPSDASQKKVSDKIRLLLDGNVTSKRKREIDNISISKIS